MADAPSSGGGSSWGPFEVVLILVLAIGVLSNLGGKSTIPTTSEPKKVTLTPIDTSANRCGLSIATPLSSERISGSVRVSGSVNGCNWKPKDGIALFAQVITGGGVPISDFVAVADNGTNFINTSFDTNVFINSSYSGTGYLILIPATEDPNKPISVRIPVRLVRN